MLVRATEKKILLAATKLFSEYGYSGVSTRKIAEQAGVNELTLFRTFKSKSNLLQAVIRHFAYEGNIVEKVAHDLTGDIKKDIKILIQIREIDEEGLKFTNTIDYTEFMKDYFVKKVEEGKFVGDPYLVATSIVSMIMGIFTLKVHANSIYDNANYKTLIETFEEDLIRLYVKE
jgi:AcrR family transcriptional regulator